jgi:hypothetical protein
MTVALAAGNSPSFDMTTPSGCPRMTAAYLISRTRFGSDYCTLNAFTHLPPISGSPAGTAHVRLRSVYGLWTSVALRSGLVRAGAIRLEAGPFVGSMCSV